MRKFFFGILALVAMVATSCQQEVDLGATVTPETAVLTVNVGTPQMSRAFSEAEYATNLQYAVYSNGEELEGLRKTDATISAGGTNVQLELATNKTYTIIFWAAAPGAPYTIDFDAQTVEVDYNGAECNDETRDAFYACIEHTVVAPETLTAELRRPFAQVNVGTSDLTAAATAGLVPSTSKVEVKGVCNLLNLVTGAATGSVDVDFTAKAIPAATQAFPTPGYSYLAMNYVLVGKEESAHDVKYTIKATDNTEISREIGAVPLRANYRTNIYGKLLTNTTDVNVEIKPGYSDDNKYEIVDGKTKITVDNLAELQGALNDPNVDIIVLGDNIDLNAVISRATTEDPKIVVAKGKTLTIDLNDKKLSASSSLTTNPREMFLVKGNLTIKNGTIEYEHVGENMAWNAMTTIFDITDGGVVNLDSVVAKNLGGTDMTFVVHLNNWGEVTLNVDNSTLEAPYIAVRAFNSGYDMNNITIKNSTLKGKYCFWVHNYKAAGDAVGTDETLNLDILNGTNTFIPNEGRAPILYGFANPIYYDANGNEWVADGVSLDENGNYLIYNAKGLKWVADVVNATTPYTPTIFDDKVVKLLNDINLNNEEWIPIGDDRAQRTEFHGIFDGQGFSVKNVKITKKTDREDENKSSYGLFGNLKGTVKNLTVENVSISGAPKFIGALVGRMNDGLIENCHVKTSSVECENWTIGGLVGQLNNGKISGCSVEDTTIKGYAGVGAIAGLALNAGERTIENCSVNRCAIVRNGSFGGNYDLMFGGIVGALYNGALTVNLNNCSVENTTILGVESDVLCGFVAEGDKLLVDGYEFVTDGVGKDTEGNYYISKAAGLTWFSDQLNNQKNTFAGKTIKVVNDIDMAGVTYYGGSIKSYPSYCFKGTFDGGEKVISNLTITVENDVYGAAALIPTLAGDGTTIKNVTLKNVNISSSHYAAGIWGYTTSDNCYSIITNCHIEGGTITGNICNNDNADKVGGIGGIFYNGVVSGCSVKNVTISAYRDCAGIVGWAADTRANVKNNSIENVTINVNNANNYKNYTTRAQYDVNNYVGEGVGKAQLEGNTGEASINWGSIAE